MSSLKFKKFTNPHNLKSLGLPLIGQFFEKFQSNKISLPDDSLDDDKYFSDLSAMLMTPDTLPDDLNETLHAIDEMSNEHGQERLENAIKDNKLELQLAEDSSHLEIALHVWLADPKLPPMSGKMSRRIGS